jgi:hypothetical protein
MMSKEEATSIIEMAIDAMLSEAQKAELKKLTLIAFVDFNQNYGDRVAVAQRDVK